MFSAHQLIIQNGNYIFQSLNHVDINLKPHFLIKCGYHIVPSPSTALPDLLQFVPVLLQFSILMYGGHSSEVAVIGNPCKSIVSKNLPL